MICAQFDNVFAQFLTVTVQGKLLGSYFLEYQQTMTTIAQTARTTYLQL